MTMSCITPGRPRAHIKTKVLLRHIMGAPLLGPPGIDLHLGQKPKLGGGIPTSHSSIHHILLELCISMIRFLFIIEPLEVVTSVSTSPYPFCFVFVPRVTSNREVV